MKKLYAPILRGKRGELVAMQNSTEAVKSVMYPLFQVVPSRINTIANDIANYWGQGRPIMIDRSYLSDNQIAGGFMDRLFDSFQDLRIDATPVLEFEQSQAYHDAVRELVHRLGTRVAIRVRRTFNPRVLNLLLNDMIGNLGISRDKVDLVIDFEHLSTRNLRQSLDTTLDLIRHLPLINEWRNVFFCTGSFPENLAGFEAGNIYHIDRLEQQFWAGVSTFGSHLLNLCYGDYGNIHPIFDPSQQAFQGSASIKYSTASEYVIMRGQKAGNNALGNGQYRVKSADLIQTPDFSGGHFSFGDNYIQNCATNPNAGTGNAEKWVTATLNHHFALIESVL